MSGGDSSDGRRGGIVTRVDYFVIEWLLIQGFDSLL